MSATVRVRRRARRVVAEYGGRRWLLPLAPSAAARAELGRLAAILRDAEPGSAGDLDRVTVDFRAIAGPTVGADWERLPARAAVPLARGAAEAWGLAP